MPEHVDLTDPELHEPKGIATAVSGDVYVADGLGSGVWLATGGNPYANINTVESDSVAVGTIGTTAQTLPFSNDGPASVTIADSANNRITIGPNSGVFLCVFSLSFTTTASGDAGNYEFKLMDDGVATSLACAREMSGSNDQGSITMQGILSIASGSHITVEVESDNGSNTDDIQIYNAQLTLTLLEET